MAFWQIPEDAKPYEVPLQVNMRNVFSWFSFGIVLGESCFTVFLSNCCSFGRPPCAAVLLVWAFWQVVSGYNFFGACDGTKVGTNPIRVFLNNDPNCWVLPLVGGEEPKTSKRPRRHPPFTNYGPKANSWVIAPNKSAPIAGSFTSQFLVLPPNNQSFIVAL